MWDLSCPDWEDRIREGRSLIPDLPLNETEAKLGLAFFDMMKLPDVPGMPALGKAAGQWFRDIVRAVFGSWDPETGERHIRDVFVLAAKGSSKTSYSAGLIMAAMIMNRRPRAEMLFVGPTQAISDRAYDQAAGMVEEDADMRRRFVPRNHIKVIEDLHTRSEVRVKTFAADILTGVIPTFVLLDELHLLGRSAHTARVLRQIRGGLEKVPEGMLLITTTQSDEQPSGAFKDELMMARKIRDGEFRGKNHRPMLPVLYEFPEDIARDQDKWSNPKNWPMVLPNLGRPTKIESLISDWESEKQKGEHATRIWASQQLNIEIGIGLRTDRWGGAEYWDRRVDPTMTLEILLDRSEVVIIGIDGGGLDDLLGLAVLGRDRLTKEWLCWTKGWCHIGVLDRRKSIAQQLLDFQASGELTIVDDDPMADELSLTLRQRVEAENEGKIDLVAELDGEIGHLRTEIRDRGYPADIAGVIEIVKQVKDRKLLREVAVDPAGLGLIVDALDDIGVTQENKLLQGVSQGFHLMDAIKTGERRLANGTFWHAASTLMDWNVGNVKIEPTATAIRATKQNAGDAKIDVWAAMINAVDRMSRHPVAPPRYRVHFLGAPRATANAA